MAYRKIFAALSLAVVSGGALACTVDSLPGARVTPSADKGEANAARQQDSEDYGGAMDPNAVPPVTPSMDAGVDGAVAADGGPVSAEASTDGAATTDASDAAHVEASTDASSADAATADASTHDASPVDAGSDASDSGPDAGATHATFDVTGAVLAGTGCTNANTTVTATGGALHVAFGALKIALPPGAAQLADRRACLVRVPVDIPTGFYVSKLTQHARYSVDKSSGATASVSTHATVMNLLVSPETVQFGAGTAVNLPNGVLNRTDTFGSSSAMCNARPSAGLMAINVAMSGQRASTDKLNVSVPDFDFREGFELELTACP